jgi:putative membrane protein
MQTLISLLLSSLAVFVTAYILPGVHVDSFLTAIVVAVVIGVVNALILPLLLIVTLPINILTFGLFTLVVIGLLVMGVSAIVPGFTVDGFWWALAFAVVLFFINSFIKASNVGDTKYR